MTLHLRCEICGTHQVGGLLSSTAWGRLDGADGPLACPDCVQEHPDWREQLASSAAPAVGD
jgi:hypothetical protein